MDLPSLAQGVLMRTDPVETTRSVLIVDDHASFRDSARLLLEGAGFEVVGESEDAAGALAAATRLEPAIVLLDIGLPDGDGFEVAERLAEGDDPPAVILVSSREVAWYRRRLANSPARGFIAKGDLSAGAVEALVHGGKQA
jgi:DNA-binding NarL/FixJ family response regulator